MHKSFSIILVLITNLALAQTYFQQTVNFKIDVSLDDENHFLHAFEEVTYVNNSPDTLKFIYFHLWPNGYKNNETAMARQFIKNESGKFHFLSESDRGYIDSLDFRINEEPISWQYDPNHEDICKLLLLAPLQPGDSVIITTPFRVKIPADISRLGHVGQSYQITQWYPKPAVYDHKGWHPMPYLDQGEFYSEFGSFEVKITVPENYKVAATGELQEEKEQKWLQQEVQKTEQFLALEQTASLSFPVSARNTKTLTYIQDQIHDFAWFADKRYLVNQSQVKLASGKSVTSWSFFLPGQQAENWYKAAYFVDSALYYYSKWVGEYPYSSATAVQGALSAGGGMEYPMITVISAGFDEFSLDQVVTHEVGHNWFYGILASNERMFPWMDEGFNSFIENRYMNKRYPEAKLTAQLGESKLTRLLGLDTIPYRITEYLSSTILGSYGKHAVINTPSDQLNAANYGLMSYYRTSALLTYFQSYLGDDLFDACMSAYFEKWKFRHPYPEDIKAVFSEVSGKNLDWFFDDFIDSRKQADYAAAQIIQSTDGSSVKIKNKGTIAAPYPITFYDSNDKKYTQWVEGHFGTNRVMLGQSDINKITINADYVLPETSLSNNTIKTSGIFKKTEPLQFNLITGLSNHSQKQVHFLPLLGSNTTDLLLAGGSFHNLDFQGKQFNYWLAPMYSFGNQTLAGNFIMKYDWITTGPQLTKIRLMGQHKRFSGYEKYSPSLTFFFKATNGLFQSQHLNTSYHYISNQNLFNYPKDYQFATIAYQAFGKNALRTQQLDAKYQFEQGTSTFHRTELAYRYDVQLNKKLALKTYWFAGALWGNNVNPAFWLYSSSSPDFEMNYYMIDRAANNRFDGIGQKMILNDQGGFKIANIAGRSSMTTASAELLGIVRFAGIFGDLGFVDGDLYYDTGISLKSGPIKVYIPIASNVFTGELPKDFKEMYRSIRFSLTINKPQIWNNLDKVLD